MEINNKKIVAVYARSATLEATNDSNNLEEQKIAILDYCNKQNYTIYNVYSEIGSGNDTFNLPAFKQMLLDMKNQKFSTIVFLRFDRISRSITYTYEFLKIAEDNNCEVEFVLGNINVSSKDNYTMLRNIISTFSQFEKELVSARVKGGLENGK